MEWLRQSSAWKALAGVLLLGGCSDPTHFPARVKESRPPVQGWMTTADHSRLLAPIEVRLGDEGPAALEILVDPSQRHQRMVGFGAALTDAAAGVIHGMPAAARRALMKELFGPAPGLGLGLLRLTIGASDFSVTHYSLDDRPSGQSDPGLTYFSLGPVQDTVVPVMREALSFNPSVKVMASPWSAPGWMKTSDALVHGTLRPEHYGVFANYLVRYVEAMQAQGVPIFALTLQNEPHLDTHNYPGMVLTPEARATIIGRFLGPALRQHALATEILDWDHNWNHPEEPLQVLADPVAARYIAGVAWHCYEGKVSAQIPVHEAHPDKDAYLTECSGGGWEPASDPALLHMSRELLIGSVRGWSRGVLLWNLALDPKGGPHLGGCDNCRGVVTIGPQGSITRNDEYYVLAHASRFVRPGAERIESSETQGGLANVAFLNPDGSIVLIAANSTPDPRHARVREGGLSFQLQMPGRSLVTYTWRRRRALGGAR